jgi:ABC-2 type transport system permease protein
MRAAELAKRNLKEVWRDPLSLAIALVLPLVLLLVLQSIGSEDVPMLMPTMLTPGVTLFGFVMLMFSAAMILARDRETALLARLLTTPLRSSDFVFAYSLPYVLASAVLTIVLFAVGAVVGLENNGSVALVALVLFVIAVFYVALGMILGAVFTVTQVSGGYAVVLLLTIFGGAWFDLEDIGGAFETVGNVLPFKHALDATRAVMADGARFGDITTDLAWVGGYTGITVTAAVFLFRRRMIE